MRRKIYRFRTHSQGLRSTLTHRHARARALVSAGPRLLTSGFGFGAWFVSCPHANQPIPPRPPFPLQRVCRAFYAAAHAPELWTAMDLTEDQQQDEVTDENLMELLTSHKLARSDAKLSLRGCKKLTGGGIMAAFCAGDVSGVTHMDLADVGSVNAGALSAVMECTWLGEGARARARERQRHIERKRERERERERQTHRHRHRHRQADRCTER